MPSWTTADLIATIKTKGLVPTNQSTFTSSQILIIADEELQMGIIPLIKEVREEYFVTYQDTTLINGQARYPIPERAVGSGLMDILIVDTSNQQQYSVPLIEASEAPYRNSPYGFTSGVMAYLEGNDVVFIPSTNLTGGTLRLKFMQRRNNLVEVTAAGRIDSIDTLNNQITLGNIPSTFNTNVTYDLIKAKPGFDCLAIDQTCTGISGAVFTFASLPSGLQVGDYLALAGESPIVQIPVEFHMVLAQRVIVRILEALGDSTGVQIARTKLEELQRNALKLITPRVQGEAKKVSNPFSTLNGGSRWGRWWNG